MWTAGVAILLMAGSPVMASEMEIDYCHLELSESWMRANASFSVAATFSVDPQGSPGDVQVILGQRFVNRMAVESCIRSWRMPAAEERGSAVWYWLHGRGWQSLRVSVGRAAFRLKVSGDRCPYLRRACNAS